MTGWTARTALRRHAARALHQLADALTDPDGHQLTDQQRAELGIDAEHGVGVTIPAGSLPYVERAVHATMRRHADGRGSFDPDAVANDLRAAAARLERR